MLLRWLLLLEVFQLLAELVIADTCSTLEATTSIEVTRPLSLSYTTEQQDYWSTSCAALLPTCIIFPKDAAEIAAIITVLNSNEENFAVKSGGHNPNNYWSSVDGGPLISTQLLDQVILNQTTGVAKVGPGLRLDEIARELDGTGWTFVGGRIGHTGVGGLILGGGLSYMSTQYGWAASSVLEYELVLPNGTISHVNAESNPDLFKALKGGGNNFGVVVSYTLQTYRQGNVWGGNLVFLRTPEIDLAMLNAVRDFTDYNDDDKAAIIVTAERAAVGVVDSWIIFLFYDGPSPPDGLFNNFTNADPNPLLNTCHEQSYADLIGGSNWVIVKASNVQIGTETIPMPPAEHGEAMMEELHTFWRGITDGVMLTPGIVASIAYQPFSRRIAQEARARGGDLIDADDEIDRMIIEMNYAFTLPQDYPTMDQTMQDTYGGYRDRVLAWQASGEMPQGYLPLFMNYGFHREDYFARLRPESRALAKKVSDEVDPDGIFRLRTGGWKP
ncbi:FAD-binding domain-containing protein [Thozetella sp. PMI_491]|nr:FAD-binding domain-containing protein [Thozetella sp. PMI_491]